MAENGNGGTTSESPAHALEVLFAEYSPRVYRYCLGRLGSVEAAEDAVQVTYLNAWRSLESGTKPVEPSAWLLAIAANVCSSDLRSALRRGSVELRPPADLEEVGSEPVDGDELFGLRDAVAALPERQRRALVLRDLRGLSYGEIATALNASHPAVETLLFRARRAVAASLTHSVGQVRRVPVRSALSAILPLSSGYSSAKAALASGAGVIKVSFAVGIGAVVPLVVFGVLERGLGESRDPAATPPPAISNFEPDVPAGTVTAELEPQPPRRDATPATEPRTSAPAGRSGGESGEGSAPAQGGGGDGGAPGQTGEPGEAEQPTSDAPTPSEPPPAPESPKPPPPPKEPTEPELVVLCHVTGSKKKPPVTISVAPAAVDAHLAHGDTLGPCPD